MEGGGGSMLAMGADTGDKLIQKCFRGKLQEAMALLNAGASVNNQNEVTYCAFSPL